ncbi:hypothetical protein [Brevundimonas sp.]|uniref:hypothetical protein n=1 Tax=Brevundimonas sp. TaxID=1871086 RepID=UPI0025C152C2|nr:hypothetical protein [Brevundimonas sp.]
MKRNLIQMPGSAWDAFWWGFWRILIAMIFPIGIAAFVGINSWPEFFRMLRAFVLIVGAASVIGGIMFALPALFRLWAYRHISRQ